MINTAYSIIKEDEMMYYLSSSPTDRISFDEAARARARKYMRAAPMPLWEIDPVALARCVIEREQLPATDNPKQAESRYINAFCQTRANMLRDEVDALLDGVGEIASHIRTIRLLRMPDIDSLKMLGDAVEHYMDNGNDADGDAWLAPVEPFSDAQFITALRTGGKVIKGYSFPYPCSVAINPDLLRTFDAGEVAVRGWCGYNHSKIGYALSRKIAKIVCAASMLAHSVLP
jgi:hypothetical protein